MIKKLKVREKAPKVPVFLPKKRHSKEKNDKEREAEIFVPDLIRPVVCQIRIRKPKVSMIKAFWIKKNQNQSRKFSKSFTP